MTHQDEHTARLAFLEAAYDWEEAEDAWLRKVLEATARVWGRTTYTCAFAYDASDVANFRYTKPIFTGPAPFHELFLDAMSRLPPEVVANTYRAVPLGFGRPIGVIDQTSSDGLDKLAVADVFALNALDPSGKGCFIGLGVDRTELSSDKLLVFQRLSSHLSSAYRCRRRLQELHQNPMDDWEALFHPDGRLLDARGAAETTQARESIYRAARSIEDLRRGADDEPTVKWIPRVRGRWTLVDAFTQNGERFVVARENQSWAPGLETLTDRERQVVISATGGGKSTKEIAYDLGISYSTARVLLARACARLGVRSREELSQLPAVKALRGEPKPA